MTVKDVVEIHNKNFKDSLALNLFGKDYDTAVKENKDFVDTLWNKAVKTLTTPMTPHKLLEAYPDEVFGELLNRASISNACDIINNISSFIHSELHILQYVVVEIGDGYFKVKPLGCFEERRYPKLFKFLRNFKFVDYKRFVDYDLMGCSFVGNYR